MTYTTCVLTFASVLIAHKHQVQDMVNNKTNIPQQPQSVQQIQVLLGNQMPANALRLVQYVQICETLSVNLESQMTIHYWCNWVTTTYSECWFTDVHYYTIANWLQCFVLPEGLKKNATSAIFNHWNLTYEHQQEFRTRNLGPIWRASGWA